MIRMILILSLSTSMVLAGPIGGLRRYFGNLDSGESASHRVLGQSLQPVTFSAESTGKIECCLSSGSRGELLCTRGKVYCVITYIPSSTDQLYFSVTNMTRLRQAYWGKAE